QRIYALAADGSTTGQYIGGLDASSAKKKGLLIQLRNNGGAGQVGTFRTNIGGVNPNPTTANVTWRLYDKNNPLVGQPKPQAMPPYAVIAPTSVLSFSTNPPATADLTDAWLSYESDQPIFAYSSIVDNATADGTLIPAYEDTGVQQTTPPAGALTFDVTLQTGQIIISPTPTGLANNAVLRLRIHSADVQHGFRLVSPTNAVLTDGLYAASDGIVEKIVTLTGNGTYAYMCTVTTCSPQHNSMYGTFNVGDASDRTGPGY